MIKVTAAIILDNNKIFIAQRKKSLFLGSKWELPGGKIEENESPEECLKRELREEFGIETKIQRFFDSNIHEYDQMTVELLAYNVKYISGEFVLTSHDDYKWVIIDELKDYDFAEADKPIIKKIMVMKNK
ncbi:(deoxy)nucleoside triphosphate pyrophosphohydrolase [Candidatus Bathyarchaeota archaeon]|nr:(deoxy)nucleoside triphosphate pyrophosphohydrolase [Candidatus Bathyarchaeota archaeon]